MLAYIRQVKVFDTKPGSAAASTIAGSFDGDILPGSTLLVLAQCNDTGTPSTSVSDSVNGSYPAAIETQNDANASSLTMMRLFCLQGALAGSTLITSTFGTTPTFRAMAAVEVAGVLAASLDPNGHTSQIQAAPGTGTDAITSGVTSTLSNLLNLVIAFSMNTSGGEGPPLPGSNFTNGGIGWAWDLGFYTLRIEAKYTFSNAAVAGTFTAQSGAGSERYTTFVVTLASAADPYPYVRPKTTASIFQLEEGDGDFPAELTLKRWF